MYQNVVLALAEYGYSAILEVITDEMLAKRIPPKVLTDSKVDSIIVMGPIREDYPKLIRDVTMPVVYLDFYDEDQSIPSVVTDNVYGMYCLTRYLIEKGHRKLAFVGSIDATPSILDRYLGYYRALLASHIVPREDYLIPDRGADGLFIDFKLPLGDMPTAFVCNCDDAGYVLDAGFNVIRVPVSWTNHIGPEPEYRITDSWMERVKEVVDYAYDKGAYVILNIHHEDWNYPYYDNLDRASAEMAAVWGQIAEVFRDYDEHLIFEGQNEPRKIGTPLEWNGGDAEGWEVVNKTNKVFIDTVRASDGSNPYRMLMIPGYAANCSVGIQHIEVPENDNRVIISVHAYEPYDFALNKDGRSEWNHDTEEIDRLMRDLQTLFLDKGTPVIIGEFGAMNKDNESARAEWAEYYVSAAKKAGVCCIWWDNGLFEGDGERFGLFDRHTYECRYPQLLDALMRGVE